MDHRLRLFERFCFPSIESQTEQNFTWLVFLHPRTDRSDIRRLARLQNRRFFEMAFTEQCDKQYLSSIACSYADADDLLITTRFDNDDALHSDYMRRVQKTLAGTSIRWLNFDQGLRMDYKGVYTSHHRSNAFLSRIERVPDVITALTPRHSDIRKTELVEHVRDFRGWLQVVHGRNVANAIGKQAPTSSLKTALSLLEGYCPAVCEVVHGIYKKKAHKF
jgi:hypothetical protein